MINIPWLDDQEEMFFPPTETALTHPNGLLAAGGELTVDRLLLAYSLGIFPWYSRGEPVLWWTPNPRCVLFPNQVHCSKSLNKVIKRGEFRITFNQSFDQVIRYCAETRVDGPGTWITAEIIQAYSQLHSLGFAHSVEAWNGQRLVGGLYGVALGKIFYGESMFSLQTNASKVAFITLVRRLQELDYRMIDCQVASEHLKSFGAVTIARHDFETMISRFGRFSEHGKPGNLI